MNVGSGVGVTKPENENPRSSLDGVRTARVTAAQTECRSVGVQIPRSDGCTSRPV